MLSDKASTIIIYLVAIVWVGNMVAAMIPGTYYRPDPAVHGIFTLIVGGAFALRAQSEGKGRGDDK